jgi:beta-lactamase superfamily II metal-dependent hydrolase
VRNRLRQGAEIGPVSVLLAADGGYAPGNPPEWINNLHPQLVILSTGADECEKRVDPILIENLAGYSLLRTDQQGTIRISTDGIRMDVTVEKIK